MSDKHKHLELIQGVVNRLSNNSFLLKGWSVILISGMFVLSAKDSQIVFSYLAYFPALAFWVLDAYFLRQEKLFRALYEKVRLMRINEIDFSLKTKDVEDDVDSIWSVLFSKTLVAFHGIVIASIFIVSCFRI